MRMAVVESLRLGEGILKRYPYALYLALTEPGTWYATVVGAIIAAYAIGPLDLIPNTVPVLGYVDEAIVLPAGIALVLRLVPHEPFADWQGHARTRLEAPADRVGAAAIIGLWLTLVLSLAVVVRSLTE
jgi:uncharacterized membrane protein YkvA (DUF1232 family)